MQTIFQNCRLIDGVHAVAREHVDVTVEGRRILAVEETRPREGTTATLVDCAGLTVLPGLIDCHAHYTLDPWSTDSLEKVRRESDAVAITYAARSARVALQAGITSTRDAGAPRQLNFALRDAIAAGLIPGPRLLAPASSTSHCATRLQRA